MIRGGMLLERSESSTQRRPNSQCAVGEKKKAKNKKSHHRSTVTLHKFTVIKFKGFLLFYNIVQSVKRP